MNKADLIDAIAAESKLTKTDSKKALDAYIKATTNTLKAGGRVALVGFGSFAVVKRNARTGRNPQTGKPINIKAKKVVKFKAGTELIGGVQ
jgi:DNA-binding protein HU-beta